MRSLCFANTLGNSFIIVDALDAPLNAQELDLLHRLLIQENRDDLLILTQKEIQGDALIATMQVFGQDRTFGEFCGNGALAVAAFLFSRHTHFKRFFLRTRSGLHPLQSYEQGIYSVTLPFPTQAINPSFIADKGKLCKEEGWSYVEMLEPHLVMYKCCTEQELFQEGRRLNSFSSIFPKGINVNVCFLTKEGHFHVKTYERGVQKVTAACGTGSIACVIAHDFLKKGTTVFTKKGSLEVIVHSQGVELKASPEIEKLFLYQTQ